MKQYLRGFGTGVIFATIILMIAFAIKNNVTTNKNKDNNYKETSVENIASSGNAPGETLGDTSALENTTNILETTDKTTYMSSKTTEQQTGETTEQQTGETTEITEETTEPTKESTEVIGTNEIANNQVEKVEFTVTKGMISNKAAKILEDLGVVENGYDFNMYLFNNGYESKLRVGTYEVYKGMSYEELAKIITNSR